MKRMLLLAVMSASLASAGIVKVATYPVRHPRRLVHHTFHVVRVIVW